jgi:imidazolonepropionase
MPTLFSGTGRLTVAQPAGRTAPDVLTPWALQVGDDGRIAWVGPPEEAPRTDADHVDLGSALVTPGLVDAHTHPVFAGDRSAEAAARLEGAPYTGGGILSTVAATRAADDATLEALVEGRLHAAMAAGTTTVECKSGYGLSVDEELRHLRLLGRVAGRLPLRVVRTLLGAHAVPPDVADSAEQASIVADEMIPAAAAEHAAEFVDVFADRGFFTLEDVDRIGRAAARHGLRLRLHAEQLARTGAAELGVRLGATSVDHLEHLDDAGVAALATARTVATLLPGPALVMRDALPPARALLDAGARVALASDANAGTFGAFGAMPFVIGLGATLLEMSAGEALHAATAGAAASLGLSDAGVVRAGAEADLVAWDAEHEGAFALRLGAVRPVHVWMAGREVRPD